MPLVATSIQNMYNLLKPPATAISEGTFHKSAGDKFTYKAGQIIKNELKIKELLILG